MIRYIFALVSAIVIVGMTILVFILPQEASKNSVLIKNVRVFDGVSLSESQDIRVVNGLIEEIAPEIIANSNEALVMEEGLTALPGLIDAHTHSYGNGRKDALRFGVTAHLDMFTAENGLRASRAERESLDYSNQTDMFSAGTMATVEGGHGTQYGFAIDTIERVDEVEDWIQKRKAAGVDYIKLVYMPYQSAMPSLDLGTATAVIEQAHQAGFKVYAHISKQAAAKDMLEAGIDGLVHIFADSVATDEFLALAKTKDIVVIPTLAVIASVDSQQRNMALAENTVVSELLSVEQSTSLKARFGFGIPGYSFNIAKQNVKRLFDAGVTILAGSDAPNSGTAYGVSAHHEMQLLVEAGLSPVDALQSATSLPAKQFGLVNRGTIKVGNAADLILVSGNVGQNVNTSLNIKHVFKNGYAIQRELSQSSNKQELETGLLGDFESAELETITHFAWAPSDDSIANGQSVASIARISSDSGVLKVTTEIKPGFAFPWAGVAVGDFEPPVVGVDTSAYTALSFRIKGTVGTYRVMAFSPLNSGIPPAQEFQVTENWQTITLKLSDFDSFDQSAFSGFAFVSGPAMGKFDFMLDDVTFH